MVVESHFTTGRFRECAERARSLQGPDRNDDSSAIDASMRVLEVLALAADERPTESQARLDELARGGAGDLTADWSWASTRYYVKTTDAPGINRNRRAMLEVLDWAGSPPPRARPSIRFE